MAIHITPEWAQELQGLAIAAQSQEHALAEKLQTYYITNKELQKNFLRWSGYGEKMGETADIRIIKSYYKFITSIGENSNFLIDAILNDTIDKLQKDRQDIARQIAMDKGIQQVLKDFKANKKMQMETGNDTYGAYAGGNKNEAATYAQIIKNLMEKNLGQGIKIHDTSPHDFQDSVLFDIQMSIDGFPFNLEVKSGVVDDYRRSHFKYGTFSSTALGGGIDQGGNRVHDDTYAALLPLIGVEAEELVDAIINGAVTDKIIERFAIKSAIAYLKWRIHEGRFPLFVKNKQINTCSEIINGLLTGKGYVDYENFKVNLDETRDIITRYKTSPYIDFMDGEIKNIQKEALNQALKNRMVTPKFKSTVWYGKPN